MVKCGLDILLNDVPAELRGKKVGVVCHAASVTSTYTHILEAIRLSGQMSIGAVFGPQHGLFGQTQDNMIEWEGGVKDPTTGCPIYSLYGRNRKPTPAMLEGIDALLIDLQDVGARPYTYIWTMKHCMEACAEKGVPVYILDRPNPIACVGFDGPMLEPDYFTFVGGAEIPLCHRMTIGEIAQLVHAAYLPSLELHVVWMDGWNRDSLFSDTGLPWVLPSPNMPTLDTAIVYPGMVLLEATNLSEGRGTTRPFELFGAPYLGPTFLAALNNLNLPGCFFREHCFIPTFQKWQGTYCYGLQLHVSNPQIFKPVLATAAIFKMALQFAGDEFIFKQPPYEYEANKMPVDILAGSDRMRLQLLDNVSLADMEKSWDKEREGFTDAWNAARYYPEHHS